MTDEQRLSWLEAHIDRNHEIIISREEGAVGGIRIEQDGGDMLFGRGLTLREAIEDAMDNEVEQASKKGRG